MGLSTEPNGINVVKPLGERLADALRGALGLGMPGGMPPKQLARDLGVDTKTVYSWMAGMGIRGEHLDALIQRMPQDFCDRLYPGSEVRIVKFGEAQRKFEHAKKVYADALLASFGDVEQVG